MTSGGAWGEELPQCQRKRAEVSTSHELVALWNAMRCDAMQLRAQSFAARQPMAAIFRQSMTFCWQSNGHFHLTALFLD